MRETAKPGKAIMPHLWKSALVSGLLAVLLGVLVLAWPGKTLLIAAIFFGVYLWSVDMALNKLVAWVFRSLGAGR